MLTTVEYYADPRHCTHDSVPLLLPEAWIDLYTLKYTFLLYRY